MHVAERAINAMGFGTVVQPILPDAVSGWQFFVVGEDSFAWCASMVCPCGCGETLQMSLLLEGRPRWTFEEHNDGTSTLHLSVW